MTIERKKIRTVLILILVAFLYTIYRYQGSAEFFLRHFSTQGVQSSRQALSVYYQWGMAFFLLGVIPALTVRFIFKERLRRYGISLKRPLVLLFITVVGVVIATPLVYLGARRLEFFSLYPLVMGAGESPGRFLESALFYLFYYIGYEFCFRGFLFMGIKDDIGEWQAIGVSLIATVMLHVTSLQPEMALAILVGVAFPLIVSRVGSLLPVILIHAYAGIALDYWIIVHSGGF